MEFSINSSYLKWLFFTIMYFVLFGLIFFFVMIGADNLNYDYLLYFGSSFILFIAALAFAGALKLRTDAVISSNFGIANRMLKNIAGFDDIRKSYSLLPIPVYLVVIRGRLVPICIPGKSILKDKDEVKENFKELLKLHPDLPASDGIRKIANMYL